MEFFLEILTDLLPQTLIFFKGLEPVAKGVTLIGVLYTAYGRWKDGRKIRIIATCDQRRQEISKIPQRAVTRAEVLGLVAQAVGGKRLDFSEFNFTYDFGREVLVELGESDFALLES